ncbi:hypothetical protein [Geminicoccus roseus]|uniref:hypothetical protein n=1 Tax=Geminicoccus roseus TaxID=404900 RepID=UPI000406699E|nr:hypothetical protein [Geminicoccus roseus]
MADQDKQDQNWLQIRKRIDAEKSPDPDPTPEPALSPMGTDDEAAGVTTAPADIARSAGPEAPPRQPPRQSKVPLWVYGFGAVAVLVILLLVLGSAST